LLISTVQFKKNLLQRKPVIIKEEDHLGALKKLPIPARVLYE